MSESVSGDEQDMSQRQNQNDEIDSICGNEWDTSQTQKPTANFSNSNNFLLVPQEPNNMAEDENDENEKLDASTSIEKNVNG